MAIAEARIVYDEPTRGSPGHADVIDSSVKRLDNELGDQRDGPTTCGSLPVADRWPRSPGRSRSRGPRGVPASYDPRVQEFPSDFDATFAA
jgi:hypothetical protein